MVVEIYLRPPNVVDRSPRFVVRRVAGIHHDIRGLGRMLGGSGRAPPGAGGGSNSGGNPMLPHATVVSNGQIPAAAATPYNEAPDPDAVTTKAGPLTFQETGFQFLRITRPVKLVDAVASLTTGVVLVNGHALSGFIGNIGNRQFTIYNNMVAPGAAQRHPPALTIQAGVDLILQAYQLSGAGAEVNQWTLDFA